MGYAVILCMVLIDTLHEVVDESQLMTSDVSDVKNVNKLRKMVESLRQQLENKNSQMELLVGLNS